MTHKVWQLDVRDWARFQGDVRVEGTLYVHGVPISEITQQTIDAMTARIVELEAAVAALPAQVAPPASAAFIPSTFGAELASAPSASAARNLLGAVPAPLPQAVIPQSGLITLLTQLTTRLNAVCDALVAAGYARYQ